MFVDRPDISNSTHKNGIFSATYLVRGLLKKQLRYSGLSAHSQNILLDLPNVAPFSYKLLSKRVFSPRKLPSVISANRANLYTLRLDSEQVPNPHSRVMLSQRKDCFGLNQLKVDWRFTDQDIQSIETSIRLMGKAFARCGMGKISSMPVVSPAPQGGHYLGTTRMSDSSTQGVVDRHCQVHGVSNLFMWTPAQPIPNTDEVVRIYSENRSV
jgi:choline dehydrogenase-like flavoprotein